MRSRGPLSLGVFAKAEEQRLLQARSERSITRELDASTAQQVMTLAERQSTRREVQFAFAREIRLVPRRAECSLRALDVLDFDAQSLEPLNELGGRAVEDGFALRQGSHCWLHFLRCTFFLVS